MDILTRKEMYSLDRYTIEQIGIPGKELMENAGKGCSEFLIDRILQDKNRIAIFCGSGNNGGDGFVIARYLKNWNPSVYLLGDPQKMSPETHENYQLCLQNEIEVNRVSKLEQISFAGFDLVVDAIFGVGLKGEVRGFAKAVIEKINSSRLPVTAIDIASGIDADNGTAGTSIKADYTLTMAAFKRGHFLNQGRINSGEVFVIDIGIPKSVFQKFPPKAELVTPKNVQFPLRSKFSHKGDFGKIGIIAGSSGFSGAAIMASKAALRAGGGLITLFHPKGMENIFETQLLEVMTYAFSDVKNMQFQEKLHSLDVLLIGPGIGRNKQSEETLSFVLKNWEKPLVIDADGLNILAENKNLQELLKKKEVLLTPHIGEFARLIGKSIAEIKLDPTGMLTEFYQKYRCRILLKNATTIFYGGDKFYFDISGNDGLATGGSGDVLAGIIASFLGQRLSMAEAATAASYLLGITAEKLSEKRQPASIIPSDIIEEIFKY